MSVLDEASLLTGGTLTLNAGHSSSKELILSRDGSGAWSGVSSAGRAVLRLTGTAVHWEGTSSDTFWSAAACDDVPSHPTGHWSDLARRLVMAVKGLEI